LEIGNQLIEMSTIILPTSYFPPIPWLATALRSENPLIDIHEHYIKQTVRNRCTIITANGLMNLVVPVEQFRNHTPVAEIKVDYATDWQRVHEHAIRSAYGKSAFFEFYADKILPIYETQPEYLTEWNEMCLSAVSSLMKLNLNIQSSSEYVEAQVQNDLRSFDFQVKHETKADYTQVFMERHGFHSGLSVLDLLFCSGPESREILHRAL
jgi:hypothetical protein